eukprot:Gb_38273 [translate_table: standard]
MSSLLSVIFLFVLLCHVLTLPSSARLEVQDEGTVQIVFMETTNDAPEVIEASQIKTLASILGSEAAAKKAILYSYSHSMNGFSAKLTKKQINALLNCFPCREDLSRVLTIPCELFIGSFSAFLLFDMLLNANHFIKVNFSLISPPTYNWQIVFFYYNFRPLHISVRF